MDRKITINNLVEYIKKVIEEQNLCVSNGCEKNEKLLFRGQSIKNLPLIPSLGRNREIASEITIFDQERNLIEMAKFKKPQIFNDQLKPIELLSLLQHYGIPTRLLDVTENALVALYFACIDSYDKDGEVIVFKHNELDITNYPVCEGIAESYKFTVSSFTKLSDFYENIKEQPYFLEQKRMLSNDTNEEGGKWVEECCEKPIVIYSNFNLERQKLQHGRYILFPNRINKKSDSHFFEKTLTAIERDDEFVAECFIIPKDCKKEIIKNLKIFGISKEMLFNDNIDCVCQSIVEMFK